MTVVMIGLAAIGVATGLREHAIAEAGRQLSSLSLVLADQADKTMLSAALVQEAITDEIQVGRSRDAAAWRRRMGSEEVQRMLRDKIRGMPQIDAATVIAANGDVLNNSQLSPAPQANLADQDFFKAHAGDPRLANFISLPARTASNGKRVFHLSRRLNHADGSMAGLLLVGIAVDGFEKLYERLAIGLGPGATVGLRGSDSTLLAGYPLVDAMVGNDARADAAAAMIEFGKSGAEVVDNVRLGTIAGTRAAAGLTALRHVENHPLIVIASLPADVYLQGWRRSAGAIVGFAACGVAVTLAALALLLRNLRRHEHEIQAVAGGDAGTRAHAIAPNAAAEAAGEEKQACRELPATPSPEVGAPINCNIGLADVVLGAELKPEQREDLATVQGLTRSRSAIVDMAVRRSPGPAPGLLPDSGSSGAAIGVAPVAAPEAVMSPATKPEFDYAQALAECNPELVRMIGAAAIEQYPLDIAAIRAALSAADGLAAARAAHSMNGTLGLFKARPAVASARLIEKLARAGRFDEVARELAVFEPEIAALQGALALRVA